MKLLKTLLPMGILLAYGTARGEPTQTTEARKVGDFHAVELRGTADVVVAIGKDTRVDASGEPDLLPRLVTETKDGVLIVDTRGRLPSNNHLRVTITTPDLDGATISGTGDLHISGISNAKLEARLSGTGDLVISGATGAVRAQVSGTGDLRLKDLTAKSVYVDVNGTGEAIVYASQSVDARLSGTGDISVYGHPSQVSKSVSGLGEIKLR
jgi:hypothetical protein